MKITGMNPDEELPPDVAPRAYYHQPVWKRIVTIAAGPAMNLLIAFLLLFVLAFGISEPTETVGRSSPALRPRRSSSPATESSRWTESAATRRRSPRRSTSTSAPGGERDGCKASTPATVVIERDGQREVLKITP